MLLRRAARALWPHPVCTASTPAAAENAPVIAPDSSPATAPTLGEASRSWACQLEETMVKAYEPVLGGLLADTREQIVDVCRGLGARRVLDVCCGPGGLTRRMTQVGMEVCGLDMSWPMLRQARKYCGARECAAAPCTRPLLVRADATALPFARGHTVPAVATDVLFDTVPAVPAIISDCPLVPSFDAAILVLALHTMSPSVGQAAVAEMLRVAPYAIVADYRLAERNCDLPAVALGRAVEWLVGGEHYACYKAFMAAGGLEAFARNQGYSPVLRRRILGGAGTIIVLKAGV